MIEKGSINWVSVSSTRLEQKPGAEPIDRRGADHKSANRGDEWLGKVAAELRSTAPSENEKNEKPTHRGDERRKRAEADRRNGSTAGKRGAERSANRANEWTWDKPSGDQDQQLDGLPQQVRPNLKAAPVRRKKSVSAKSASKVLASWPDLKSFVNDTFPAAIFSRSSQDKSLEVARPTALNPLGGGFVWPVEMLFSKD